MASLLSRVNFIILCKLYVFAANKYIQSRVSACVGDVGLYGYGCNRLQLNTAKTEVLWCASARRRHQTSDGSMMVGLNTVQPVRSVRNLGIHLDSDLSIMRTHVARTVYPAALQFYVKIAAAVDRS